MKFSKLNIRHIGMKSKFNYIVALFFIVSFLVIGHVSAEYAYADSYPVPSEWIIGSIIGYDLQFIEDTIMVMVGMPVRVFNSLPFTYQYFTIGLWVDDVNGNHQFDAGDRIAWEGRHNPGFMNLKPTGEIYLRDRQKEWDRRGYTSIPILPGYVPEMIYQYVTIETFVNCGSVESYPWGCAGSVWYGGGISFNIPRPVGYPIMAVGNKNGIDLEFEGFGYLAYNLRGGSPIGPQPITTYIVKGILYDVIAGQNTNPREQLGAIDFVGEEPGINKELTLSSDYFIDRNFTPQPDWANKVYPKEVWAAIVFNPPSH